MNTRHIISLLMENEAGALSRVVGLFSARGYNIDALSVAPTEDATLSRLTFVKLLCRKTNPYDPKMRQMERNKTKSNEPFFM
ncbi:MAG: acetolactate synthase small subunit, partial [Neisseriaceae bacterium]|nr:acetolactate synthase small subunit [Neisseriaceae bacterium]